MIEQSGGRGTVDILKRIKMSTTENISGMKIINNTGHWNTY